MYVSLSFEGKRAVAAWGRWRRLTTRSGTWAVTAIATETVGPRASEDCDTMLYAIVRERQCPSRKDIP